MSNLTDEQKVLAWESCWQPSFDGWAIVNAEGTFMEVNPQFCEMLNVTPAQLIGRRYQDITPIGLREIDEQNAKLLIAGAMDFYVMPKIYDFGGGHTKNVILMVTRAPKCGEGQFQFFVSRIMLDVGARTEQPTTDLMALPSSPPAYSDRSNSDQSLFEWIKENSSTLIGWGIGLGAFAAGVIEFFIKKGQTP